jgi:hypothetical protein
MMSWLTSMLADGTNGSVSSKRVITLIAFLLCAYGFIASIYGYHMDTKLFDSMMYIVIAGLGFTASEKFAKKEEQK